MMDWNLAGYVAVLLTSLIGSVWWLASQFADVKKIIYETKETILSKLEYHEKHDDFRFANVDKNIWEIRLHNARTDNRRIKDKGNNNDTSNNGSH